MPTLSCLLSQSIYRHRYSTRQPSGTDMRVTNMDPMFPSSWLAANLTCDQHDLALSRRRRRKSQQAISAPAILNVPLSFVKAWMKYSKPPCEPVSGRLWKRAVGSVERRFIDICYCLEVGTQCSLYLVTLYGQMNIVKDGNNSAAQQQTNVSLQTISATTHTGKCRTIPTHQQKPGQVMTTVFANPIAMSIHPARMPAKVIDPQTVRPFLHPPRMQRRCRPPKFINHTLFSSIDQSVFIPLTTLAFLPRHSAEVTKFGLAPTRDVEAAHLELNDALTARTGLPRIRLC